MECHECFECCSSNLFILTVSNKKKKVLGEDEPTHLSMNVFCGSNEVVSKNPAPKFSSFEKKNGGLKPWKTHGAMAVHE